MKNRTGLFGWRTLTWPYASTTFFVGENPISDHEFVKGLIHSDHHFFSHNWGIYASDTELCPLTTFARDELNSRDFSGKKEIHVRTNAMGLFKLGGSAMGASH